MKSWQRFAEVFLFNFYSHKFCIWAKRTFPLWITVDPMLKERYWKIRRFNTNVSPNGYILMIRPLCELRNSFGKPNCRSREHFVQIYTCAPSTQSSLFRNIWLCPDLLKWIFGTNWSAIVSSPLFATNRCQNFSFNTFSSAVWHRLWFIPFSSRASTLHGQAQSLLFVSFVLLCRCKYNLNSNLSRTITSIRVWCSVSITMHIIQLIPSKRVSLFKTNPF